MYEVITDFLPKRGKLIDWKNSVNNKIFFKDTKETLLIIEYKPSVQKILLMDSNEEIKEIGTGRLLKSNLKDILNIKNRTGDFKFLINETIDSLIIIDRKKIKTNNKTIKYYKYKCKICGFNCSEHYKNGELIDEYWITEMGIISGNRCACCNKSSKIVVEYINSIVKTDSWMIPYFQGGYDEAKLYTKTSNKSIIPICPECGNIHNKKIKICDIYKNHSIGCSCNDNVSYPEKIIYSILSQLKEKYIYQLTKNNFKWCNKYKYDFYIPNSNILIEVNGIQHYEDSFNIKSSKKVRSYKEESENDKNKKELALNNDIKDENYIVIDCRYSSLEYIKNSILNNEKMNKYFDLSKIDWLKAEKFALSNLVKEVCLYFSNNNVTTGDISKKFKIHRSTASTWLKKGNKLNWCKYDIQEEMIKSGKRHSKQVEIFKDGVSLGVFESTRELGRQSLKLFGVKLNHSHIASVCSGNLKQHKGYTFKYK